jgi:RNA polymerase sigma-70 factor (ECF subfamily)
MLVRYLAKLTGDREVAADLTQETFVRAIRAAPDLSDAASARAWVFRTATNLARNYLRRRRIVAFLPFSGRERQEREAFDATADQVRSVLRSLPFEQATTLLLHYYAGFHRSEIARMHGVSEETVKSRLARGRKNFIAAYRRLDRGLAR